MGEDNIKIMLDGNYIKDLVKESREHKETSWRQMTPPTELGEALEQLNKDLIDPITNMTSIDMRTRLSSVEVSSLMSIDTLIALKVIPVDCLMLTRQKKRLAVSIEGKGRDEIVNIVGGKQAMSLFPSKVDEVSRSIMGLGGQK